MDEDNKKIEMIQQYFKDAYALAAPYFDRKRQIQDAFDGVIDDETWATLSEINIPILRTAVLQVVPFIFQYLFPDQKFIELLPRDEGVPFEAVERVERVLEDQILHKMNAKRNGILTLQDAVKFGCGYGEVSRVRHTMPNRRVTSFFDDGKQIESASDMEGFEERVGLKYKYIPYEHIIPTPDGDEPDDVTCVFHVDMMREDQFLDLWAINETSEDKIMKGNPEAILQRTRDGKLDGGVFPIQWIYQSMAGSISQNLTAHVNQIARKNVDRKAPVIIPVLKCYFKGEHVWLANGDTIIYHIKDKARTLTCPIIKASSCIDSGNWWCQSDVAASKDVSDGINNFRNAMMDLITYYLHPTTVYNDTMLNTPNRAPTIEPYSKIAAIGDVREAVSYLNPPPMPQQLFALGQVLEQDNASSNGQPINLSGQGVAGLVRGGSGAFESLMQTTNIRQEFLGMLLEIGWLEPLIYRTLLEMQLLPNEEHGFVIRKGNEFARISTTQDEIRNGFDIRVSLRAKARTGINQESMALTRYIQVYKDNIYVDQRAALETVQPDPLLHERLLATPEQVTENLERMRQVQMAQAEANQTIGEQRMEGRNNNA